MTKTFVKNNTITKFNVSNILKNTSLMARLGRDCLFDCSFQYWSPVMPCVREILLGTKLSRKVRTHNIRERESGQSCILHGLVYQVVMYYISSPSIIL